ncbi:MAG: Dephospho-CoA kinase [uncultured Segetibacter sp.]|uniref:Dephospho-CoA kinase n=1 Tax=uncultured Segetibacter sp. TaxID=481133 RepID=A0A6J4SQN0_9BACT|nr:MAG: Dephospho-CoA kinase [uncultured Segetibacter sp.]
MLKIGLTGGIGSGKSVVAGIFEVLGIPVFDADSEAKLVMEKDEELVLSIQKRFGKESYTNKKLNRKYIANIVFNDPAKLEQLNALVHPAAIEAANKWMDTQTTPYVVKEAALLFESGSARHLDFIIGVYAPQQLRLKRVMERDNASNEQVLARMSRQMNEEEKMKLCDFVVVNDEQKLLIRQVVNLHEKFLSM